MPDRVVKRTTTSSVRRRPLLTSIELFGSIVMPCQRCTDRKLVCKKLPGEAKCGECVRVARPCEEVDYDAEREFFLPSVIAPLLTRLVVRIVSAHQRVTQDIETLAQRVNAKSLELQKEKLRLARLQQEKDQLVKEGREISSLALAELEAWDEEDRAAGREPEPLPEERPTEASTSAAPASADWSSLDVSAFPASWLGSPPPLADP
ncbi:hypothetical protein N0V85_009815, partial [Neurospora sp. IMI 360204]